MGAVTRDQPKCLVQIAGRPLLEHTVDRLRGAGCDEIVVITGYLAHLIDLPGVRCVENPDYANNNVLHSLMYARDYLAGDTVVVYSDIWVEPWIFDRLLDTAGDIVIAADIDWQGYYVGRTEHPIDEAENVVIDDAGRVLRVGKHVTAEAVAEASLGEFLGLWRMSAAGTDAFRLAFLTVDGRLPADDAFQQAKTWRQAYATDLFQELVDNGQEIACAKVERGWAELDTGQDLRRLPEIAARQRLTTLVDYDGKSDARS